MNIIDTPLKRAEDALTRCLVQNARMLEIAERTLEAARVEHAATIQVSADNIASLENALEMYDAFEQERRAAQTRTELAGAIEAHKDVVDRANAKLQRAIAFYIEGFAARGVATGASFNSLTQAPPAVARR